MPLKRTVSHFWCCTLLHGRPHRFPAPTPSALGLHFSRATPSCYTRFEGWLGPWRTVRCRAGQHCGGNPTRCNRILARVRAARGARCQFAAAVPLARPFKASARARRVWWLLSRAGAVSGLRFPRGQAFHTTTGFYPSANGCRIPHHAGGAWRKDWQAHVGFRPRRFDPHAGRLAQGQERPVRLVQKAGVAGPLPHVPPGKPALAVPHCNLGQVHRGEVSAARGCGGLGAGRVCAG